MDALHGRYPPAMSQPPTSPGTPASPVTKPAASTSGPSESTPTTKPQVAAAAPVVAPPALTATQVTSIEKASADALEATKASRRSAQMAMVGALVAAVLSLGGTIWSAYQSSVTSQRVADKAAEAAVDAVLVQLDGETDRSRAEFLRSEQKVLYSRVISHDQALDSAGELLFKSGFVAVYATKSEEERVALDQYERAYQAFEADKPSMDIMASTSSRDAYYALVKAHRQMKPDFSATKPPKKGGHPTRVLQGTLDYQETYREQGSAVGQSRYGFLEAARADMGAR